MTGSTWKDEDPALGGPVQTWGRVVEVSLPPEALPEVRPGDLRRAWDAATLAARRGLAVAEHDAWAVRFHRGGGGGETRVMIADGDAQCWMAAVDAALGLDSLHGVAVCFRLLAMIHLMGSEPWARDLFSLGEPGGARLDRTLLDAAASLPLTAEARFDPTLFRRHTTGNRLAPPRRTD